MKALKVLKNIGLWTAVAVLTIMSLASINTFACIFGFIAIAIILPVQKWQNLLKKFLKTPVKIIALVSAIIIMLVIIGISNGTTNTDTKPEATVPTQTQSAVFTDTETTDNDFVNNTQEQTTESTTASAPATTVPVTTTVPATTAEPTTVHTHSFSEATCTSAKTCSVCGEKSGSAKGHTWKDATCTSARTCSVCGVTSGYATSHDYSDGYCTYCGTVDPDYSSGAMVWITSRGKKYHSNSGCSNMKNPYQVSESSAINSGRGPCSKCY